MNQVNDGKGIIHSAGFSTLYEVECFDKDGKLKWKDSFHNLVVNQGLDDILDKYLKGSGYNAAWYVGLTDSAPSPSATDTYQSRGSWAEVTPYSNATRPQLVLGTVSSQSVDNTSSKAVFTINSTSTVGGAFVCTSNTKGDTGAGPILYGVGAFTGGDKSVTSGDTLNVSVTLTAAAV